MLIKGTAFEIILQLHEFMSNEMFENNAEVNIKELKHWFEWMFVSLTNLYNDKLIIIKKILPPGVHSSLYHIIFQAKHVFL